MVRHMYNRAKRCRIKAHPMKPTVITRLLGTALLLLSGACAALETNDIPGTQIAENRAYQTEIARLDATATHEQATHAAIFGAQATEAAEINGVNRQLLGTLQAIVTPTPVLIEDSSIEFSSLPSNVLGNTLVASTGTAQSIRGSDGCIDVRQSVFSSSEQIFATMVAYNLIGNTRVTAEWKYRGQAVFVEDWRAPRDLTQTCLWFSLDSSKTPLLPGEWAVTIYTDGFYATAMNFEIIGN